MTVHVIVPGLLGPMPRLAEAEATILCPTVERLLTRANKEHGVQGYASTLFQLFGLNFSQSCDLPTAPLCYLEDTGKPPEGFVMHADPVYLRADQDRLLLFDAHGMDISREEADAYVSAFNRHFVDDGITLVAPTDSRWYLMTTEEPLLETHSLSDVIGRNVDFFLPTGVESEKWHHWMNEIQMLFHTVAVSAQRESEGKPPVNGLWFSGGGELPDKGDNRLTRVSGGSALVQGLAKLHQIPSGCDVRLEDGELIIIEELARAVWDADPFSWIAALESVEQQLQHWLNCGEELLIYPCNGDIYHWKSNMKWRLWRRPKPISTLLTVGKG